MSPTPPACTMLDPHRGVLYTSSSRATSDRNVLLWAWHELASGRYRLVPRDERGDRVYLLRENDPELRARCALTIMEAAATSAAANALSGKAIAYLLGIAPSTVSMSLSSAAAKLGLESWAELARLVRVLAVDGATLDIAALSAAEREVLRLLLEGKSNRAIAALRGRSERTIANQVASILRKTGCGSRRALLVIGGRKSVEAMTIDESNLASYRTHPKEGP